VPVSRREQGEVHVVGADCQCLVIHQHLQLGAIKGPESATPRLFAALDKYGQAELFHFFPPSTPLCCSLQAVFEHAEAMTSKFRQRIHLQRGAMQV